MSNTNACPTAAQMASMRWSVLFTKSGKLAKRASTREDARAYRRKTNQRTYIFDEFTRSVVR